MAKARAVRAAVDQARGRDKERPCAGFAAGGDKPVRLTKETLSWFANFGFPDAGRNFVIDFLREVVVGFSPGLDAPFALVFDSASPREDSLGTVSLFEYLLGLSEELEISLTKRVDEETAKNAVAAWRRAFASSEETRNSPKLQELLACVRAAREQTALASVRPGVAPDADTVQQINNFVELRAKVFAEELGGAWKNERAIVRRISTDFPRITLVGESRSAAELARIAEKLYGPLGTQKAGKDEGYQFSIQRERDYLYSDKGTGVNDPCAVIFPRSDDQKRWKEWHNQEEMYCYAMDYAQLRLMQDYYISRYLSSDSPYRTAEEKNGYAFRPLVPGANSVVWKIPDLHSRSKLGRSEGLLLQRRPGGAMGGNNQLRLSLFGGAFRPKWKGGVHDFGSLARCVIREVLEESGAQIRVPQDCLVAYVEEIRAKSQIQFSFIGARVTAEDVTFIDDAQQMAINEEGGVEILTMEDLEHYLLERSWELSCHAIASLLVWLAADGPGSPKPVPKNLLRRVLGLERKDLLQQARGALNDLRFSALAGRSGLG